MSGSPNEQIDAIQDLIANAGFGGGVVNVVGHLGSDGLVLIKAADDVSFEKLYEPLLALPGVEYVGPNFV